MLFKDDFETGDFSKQTGVMKGAESIAEVVSTNPYEGLYSAHFVTPATEWVSTGIYKTLDVGVNPCYADVFLDLANLPIGPHWLIQLGPMAIVGWFPAGSSMYFTRLGIQGNSFILEGKGIVFTTFGTPQPGIFIHIRIGVYSHETEGWVRVWINNVLAFELTALSNLIDTDNKTAVSWIGVANVGGAGAQALEAYFDLHTLEGELIVPKYTSWIYGGGPMGGPNPPPGATLYCAGQLGYWKDWIGYPLPNKILYLVVDGIRVASGVSVVDGGFQIVWTMPTEPIGTTHEAYIEFPENEEYLGAQSELTTITVSAYHILTVDSNIEGVPFTIDGIEGTQITPFSTSLLEQSYVIHMPEEFSRHLKTYKFVSINGMTTPTYTVSLTADTSLTVVYEEVAPPSPCFIATVAYGSPLASQLNVLRRFRDRCLPNQVTVAYYAVGPFLAQFIKRRNALKHYVREVFNLIVKMVREG